MLTLAQESEEGVLELHGDDPDALEALLQYIYTSKYPTNYPDIPTSDWKAFVNLAITADKYGFRGLHFEALLKIRDIPPLDLDDSISMLCECSALFPDEFFGFRHIIGDQWRDRFGAYIGDKRFRELMGARPHLRDELYFDYLNELMEVAEFKTMLHADGKLATDFLQKFMSDYGPASSEC